MSGSILKEVTFTPQSFSKEFICLNPVRQMKFYSILQSLISSGIVIAPNRSWRTLVYNLIENYDEELKDAFVTLLNQLESKIVTYPSHKDLINENDYLEQIEKLNSIREFDFVSSTVESLISKPPEKVSDDSYINKGAKIEKQSLELMMKMLTPVLSYAERVKIIDPYFNFFPLHSNEKSKNRYLNPMKIICENLANQHGIKNSAEIQIHTSVKAISKSEGAGKKVLRWKYVDKWRDQIQYYEKNYAHKITVYIWEEKKGIDEWHDRYIDTNLCFISIGKGSDESSWTDSTWTLVDDKDAEKISNKFKRKSIYTLVATVTSKGLNKENISMIETVEIKNNDNEKQNTYVSEKKGLRIIKKNDQ